MAYLDNTVITVDAVLTKLGRERLSEGTFQITKWALSDDEVDYSLYNAAHPLGSDYYSNIIESMPVLEAIPDETQAMRYKLYTSDAIQLNGRIPELDLTAISTDFTTALVYNGGQDLIFDRSTIKTKTRTNNSGDLTTNAIIDENYVITLFNERAFDASGGEGLAGVSGPNFGATDTPDRANPFATGTRASTNRNASNTLVRTLTEDFPRLTLTARDDLVSTITTKIRVFGAKTGATKTFTVTVNS